ncbi:MAG: hypothetical protein L6R41_001581 [Letrouitia leprolyta]|nr:MAG: hypothetical protein L6R41_001581 [Letrouitia leprolyta]
MPPLRIGFVPEHFSTPLHFAAKYFSLSATLIPFPSGTGHMVTSLRAGEIDIGIGLTEGWVAALASPPSPSSAKNANENGEKNNEFKIVGTYVESPLCWAISTGAGRDDIISVSDLQGKKMGVSRIGSGSYVMGFVLAEQEGWFDSSSLKKPFDVQPLQTFENLRKAVNDHSADFFMWEYFTSKRYYDSNLPAQDIPIKKVGEIYTPWSSWKIVARSDVVGSKELEEVFEKLNKGIGYFREYGEEAVGYISSELDYTEGDAREWMKGVRFADVVRGVGRGVLERTVESLKKAGVLGESGREMGQWVGIWREE